MSGRKGNQDAGFRNNVTRFLDSKKVPYTVHLYDYAAGVHSAVEVAAAVGLPPERVFKTLVILADDPACKPMLVVVPGPVTVELRALARQVGARKVRMAPHAEAESLTGLQTGGISALALLNKGFDVYLDGSARSLERFAISAGERGAQLQLPVTDFVKLTRARWVDLSAAESPEGTDA
jgi:Cys-tRNA(Pro)/Cys-tRNA(Cys) deacylase